jgi:hypothetical protein
MRTAIRLRLAAMALCVLGLEGRAVAQAPADPAPEAPRGGTLSDRLDRSDGVIRPEQNLDPEMRIKPPHIPSPMPVIPPPGPPGGDSQAPPKE